MQTCFEYSFQLFFFQLARCKRGSSARIQTQIVDQNLKLYYAHRFLNKGRLEIKINGDYKRHLSDLRHSVLFRKC